MGGGGHPGQGEEAAGNHHRHHRRDGQPHPAVEKETLRQERRKMAGHQRAPPVAGSVRPPRPGAGFTAGHDEGHGPILLREHRKAGHPLRRQDDQKVDEE